MLLFIFHTRCTARKQNRGVKNFLYDQNEHFGMDTVKGRSFTKGTKFVVDLIESNRKDILTLHI